MKKTVAAAGVGLVGATSVADLAAKTEKKSVTELDNVAARPDLWFYPGEEVARDEMRVSFMGSAAYSTGRLEYRGKSRKFKVVGLGIGGIGVIKTRAWGGVYNLKKLDDFTGTYVMARSGVAVGDEEVGNKRWVVNGSGVKLELNLDTDGLQLNLGADGMVVTWND